MYERRYDDNDERVSSREDARMIGIAEPYEKKVCERESREGETRRCAVTGIIGWQMRVSWGEWGAGGGHRGSELRASIHWAGEFGNGESFMGERRRRSFRGMKNVLGVARNGSVANQ